MPAKAEVQQMVGHNGYYGCGYGVHPGHLVKAHGSAKSVVRFIQTKNVIPNRTHNETFKMYGKLKSSATYGIKNISCMIGAKHFDLINGFSIDYMHAILLGVVKKLWTLWLDARNHGEAYE